MAKRCRTISTGVEVCSTPDLFTEGNLGKGPFQGGFSDEAQAVFDLMDTELPGAYKTILNTGINDLVDGGHWDDLEQFAMPLDTAANSLIDWKEVQDLLAVKSPTFTPAIGWVLNGTTQYLNSQRSPDEWVLPSQNNVDVGVWCVLHDVPSGVEMLFGSLVSSLRFRAWTDGTNKNWQANATTVDIAEVDDTFETNSLNSGIRTGVNATAFNENGIELANSATVSNAPSSDSMFIGAQSAAGVPALFFGGTVGLYYVKNADLSNLDFYNIINTMVTDIQALA